MQTQQTRNNPTNNDREDARKALEFYCKARLEKGWKPLDVILGMWGTRHWSNASKELFLQAIRCRQECDLKAKVVCYHFDAIDQYHKMRLQYTAQSLNQQGKQGRIYDAA